jgi:hypothetical protein
MFSMHSGPYTFLPTFSKERPHASPPSHTHTHDVFPRITLSCALHVLRCCWNGSSVFRPISFLCNLQKKIILMFVWVSELTAQYNTIFRVYRNIDDCISFTKPVSSGVSSSQRSFLCNLQQILFSMLCRILKRVHNTIQ